MFGLYSPIEPDYGGVRIDVGAKMRRYIVLITAAVVAGAVLMILGAVAPVIPSWQALHTIAPLFLAAVSLVVVGIAHWHAVRRTQRRWLLRVSTACAVLILVAVMLGSLLMVAMDEAYGLFPERSYAFDGSRRALYVYELSCYPPDGKWECNSYRTDIRTRIGFLPFTRTLVTCNCFYAEPRLTDSTIEFAVEHTYEPATPPARIDRRTMEPINMRLGSSRGSI